MLWWAGAEVAPSCTFSIPAGPPARVDPGAEVSLVSLLIALTADYPDLDGHTVARAVEHAAASAELLGPGLRYTRHQVEALARDRLDAAAERMATRRRERS